jgi:5-methylcytosine-specific restriction endonuclease McrA
VEKGLTVRKSDPRYRRYKQYLNSAKWGEIRKLALKVANHRCAECGTGNRLHVHHLTYARLGNERITDLQVLCKDCHWTAHHPGEQRPSRKKRKRKQDIGYRRLGEKRKPRLKLIAENERLHAFQTRKGRP